MKVKGQKLKICAKKARAANKRRVAFFPKIATRWIYFIHIFRQLLVPNLSKSEKKSFVLALVPYYTDYIERAWSNSKSKIFEFSNFDDGILEQVGTVCHLQSNNPLI